MEWEDVKGPFLEALGEADNFKPSHREKALVMARIDDCDSLTEAFKILHQSPHTGEYKNQLTRGIRTQRSVLPEDHDWQDAFDFIEANFA